MTNREYVPSDVATNTFLAGLYTYKKITEAYNGASLGKLMGVENEDARIVRSLGHVSIFLTSFNRSVDAQRRAEKLYRKHLLVTALNMVSNDFTINRALLNKPSNYNEIASLRTPVRSLAVVSFMESVQTDFEAEIEINPDKILPSGGMPDVIIYRMIVEDLVGNDS